MSKTKTFRQQISSNFRLKDDPYLQESIIMEFKVFLEKKIRALPDDLETRPDMFQNKDLDGLVEYGKLIQLRELKEDLESE